MRFGINVKSPYVYLPVVPFIWSTNFVIGKAVVREMPPQTMVTIRFSVAVLVLAVLLKLYEKKYPVPARKHYLPLVIMGLTGVVGFNSLLYTGLQYTTSTNSAIINALYPALTTVLSAVIMKEQFNFRKVYGLAFSLTGVLLIITHGSWKALVTLQLNPGDILVFLATLSWAVYSIAGKFAMRGFSPLCATTYSSFWGLVVLYPAMFLEISGGEPVSFTWPAIAALIYLGIFASVVATLLWNRGVQAIGPAKTAYFYNLLPLYSAVLANIFLDEEIHWYHLTGGAMVLSGIYLGALWASPGNQELKDENFIEKRELK